MCVKMPSLDAADGRSHRRSGSTPATMASRPLWDIVVIALMVGGRALCVTSLILSWRVIGRKLSRLAGNRSSLADRDDLVPQAQ